LPYIRIENPLEIADSWRLSDNGRMSDLARILPLWRELEGAGADYVLATVVAVQGSSYRKPGACMLLTADGRRAGTVSGGCLEAQVASRAWWLTANGPSVQRYSTAEEDGDRPYGSGCGGVVFLLLERRTTAGPLLAALERTFDRRVPLAVATILEGSQLGRRAFAGLEREPSESLQPNAEPGQIGDDSLQDLAELALASRKSIEKGTSTQGAEARAWADYRPARPGLWMFGAGDDAQPLLRLAKELGWFVSVADGRAHLATRERFPLADELRILPMKELPGGQPDGSPTALGDLHPEDAAVVMTHSFEQDARILASLLALEASPAYIGVLGPQRRTRELLGEAARLLNLPASATVDQTDRWLAQLHAPTGLDLGAESAETIALSVLAEIQKSRTATTALPLREVRAIALTITD
jgi:xanthine/CO dehydrogenase XdhC/CoxF family maturation factor